MNEALDLEFAGGVQQYLSSQHVGAHERPRVLDAAIDVAFGGEVEEVPHPLTEGVVYLFAVRNVAMNELVARVVGQAAEVGQVAGVGELVNLSGLANHPRYQFIHGDITDRK